MRRIPFFIPGKIRGLGFVLLFANLASAERPKADLPVFNPPSGTTYVSDLSIYITTETPHGVILYIHSPGPPDTVERGFTLAYENGIVIGGSERDTLSARTVAPGYAPSDVVMAVYKKVKVTRATSASRPSVRLTVRDGRLQGWPLGQAPMAIECYAPAGISLGLAQPSDSRKTWLLPGAGPMLLRMKMPDGSARPYFVRPGGSSEAAPPRK